MKKLIPLLLCAMLFASCTSGPKLYSWYDYDDASYAYLKNSNSESVNDLIKTYDKIISAQKGTRATVPPGVYADYGFLLVQAKKVEEGKKMLKIEMELYPESRVFIERIIRMLEK